MCGPGLPVPGHLLTITFSKTGPKLSVPLCLTWSKPQETVFPTRRITTLLYITGGFLFYLVPTKFFYFDWIDVSFVSYIGPLDLNMDGLYDYNFYMEWVLQTNVYNLIMMNILYIDIERSYRCYKDFLRVKHCISKVLS